MTWTIYDNGDGSLTVEWEEYEATTDGSIGQRVGGYPADAQEAVVNILEQIDSIPEGLEAAASYNPANIEIVDDQ